MLGCWPGESTLDCNVDCKLIFPWASLGGIFLCVYWDFWECRCFSRPDSGPLTSMSCLQNFCLPVSHLQRAPISVISDCSTNRSWLETGLSDHRLWLGMAGMALHQPQPPPEPVDKRQTCPDRRVYGYLTVLRCGDGQDHCGVLKLAVLFGTENIGQNCLIHGRASCPHQDGA